ncbi:MAG: rhodanese-like domain-containing protein [Micromonosporaceae bacterium]|nr:rhodanese-like domain-containing protein [Micromonosporaceae bacterium]
MTAAATSLIAPTALLERLGQPGAPRILDVRTPAEFETAHIPGAYNVPLATLQEHRDDLLCHLCEPVVLICRSGQRATTASTALAEAGLTSMLVLDGGMVAWQAASGPVSVGRPRWELERQIRLVAGLIVLISVLLSVAVPWAKWIAAFIGAGLTFAALTNTCAMGMLLAKLPYNRGPRREIRDIIADLARPSGNG